MFGVQYRMLCSVLTGAVIITGLAAVENVQAAGKLKISTVPGAYLASQRHAFFDPFGNENGVEVVVKGTRSPLALLGIWKSSSKAASDVINLSSYQAEKACAAGLLSSFEIEDIEADPNGASLDRDFLGDSLMDCAVPNVAWSALMVVKNGVFKKKKPRTWRDFFNIKKFPGKRSLKKSARYSMEMALLADGVDVDDIYATLATIKGQKRGFARLNRIKKNIVWWNKGSDAIANLNQSDVVMGAAYNGRLFNAIVKKGLDVTLVWQGQIYDYDYWGIPAKAANRSAALQFIKFATAPQRLAEQSKWMPYGPMRSSSLIYIGNHKMIDVHMSAFLPTTKAHFRRALKFNEGFWLSSDGKQLEARFKAWLDGSLTWPK